MSLYTLHKDQMEFLTLNLAAAKLSFFTFFMLWSKSSDSFVWKHKKSIKFWRYIFLYFLTVFKNFFSPAWLSNNFKVVLLVLPRHACVENWKYLDVRLKKARRKMKINKMFSNGRAFCSPFWYPLAAKQWKCTKLFEIIARATCSKEVNKIVPFSKILLLSKTQLFWIIWILPLCLTSKNLLPCKRRNSEI